MTCEGRLYGIMKQSLRQSISSRWLFLVVVLASAAGAYPAESRARATLQFFACGCEPCQELGKLWGRVQRSGELDSAGRGRLTVVFQGTKDAAEAFAAEAGLDVKRTTLVADIDSRLARKNNALPCPRLFVRDSKGRLRYTNNHKDDAAQTGSVQLTVARAVNALRAHPPFGPPRKGVTR